MELENLEKFRDNMVYIKSYIWHDGPILWLFTNRDETYLCWKYSSDRNLEYDESMFILIYQDQIVEAEAGKIEARDLFLKAEKIYVIREHWYASRKGSQSDEFFILEYMASKALDEILPVAGENHFEYVFDEV